MSSNKLSNTCQIHTVSMGRWWPCWGGARFSDQSLKMALNWYKNRTMGSQTSKNPVLPSMLFLSSFAWEYSCYPTEVQTVTPLDFCSKEGRANPTPIFCPGQGQFSSLAAPSTRRLFLSALTHLGRFGNVFLQTPQKALTGVTPSGYISQVPLVLDRQRRNPGTAGTVTV